MTEYRSQYPRPRENNIWYQYNDANTVLVFVHGILSDSRSCWLSKSSKSNEVSTFWPALVLDDGRIPPSCVFLGGYTTSLFNRKYGVPDCANELFNNLSVPTDSTKVSVLEKPNIIFVCHSTGGVIVRYLLMEFREEFAGKSVGLVLLGSPSFGSKWASKLKSLSKFIKHKMAMQIQWGSDMIKNIDDRFKTFVDSMRLNNLRGVEAYESIVPILGKWFPFRSAVVVPKFSAGRYFGMARHLPNTDHFSISKPTNKLHPSHMFLIEFCRNKFKPQGTSNLFIVRLLEVGKSQFTVRAEIISICKLKLDKANEILRGNLPVILPVKLTRVNAEKAAQRLKEFGAHVEVSLDYLGN